MTSDNLPPPGITNDSIDIQFIGSGEDCPACGHWVYGLKCHHCDKIVASPEDLFKEIEVLKEHVARLKSYIPFPAITGGNAQAIAYQLEIGELKHGNPIKHETIANWLRAIGKELEARALYEYTYEQRNYENQRTS